ncbi:hypothetical protein [Mycobacterium scrofulaceum]|uniref:hypothetical protein n=1 Tax=Mycobacterium scrofulaceum TaxID=1783 RepID=UPI001FCA3B52|nr:hypothetical protein [Mycobacterium scrofulaceum]
MLMSSTMDSRGPHRVPTQRGKSLRSKQIRVLVAVALAIPLLLAAAFLMVDRLHSSPVDALDHPDSPLSDDQSKAQVVQSARSVLATTGLRASSAGYALMSCKNRDAPPIKARSI